MYFVVFPAETLHKLVSPLLFVGLVALGTLGQTHLCDAHSTPFLFPEEFQCPLGLIMVLGRDDFEHRLGELHVPVLVLTIRVTGSGRSAGANLWEALVYRTYRAE